MKTANDVACSHCKSAGMDTFPSLNILSTLLVLRGPDVTASVGRFQIARPPRARAGSTKVGGAMGGIVREFRVPPHGQRDKPSRHPPGDDALGASAFEVVIGFGSYDNR